MEEMTFEQAMEELEQITQRMEKGEASMDDSVAMYERGQLLAGYCREKLDSYKARINKVAGGKEESFEE